MVSDTTQPSASSAALPLDARTYARALDCVHCGLCLPACPTYEQNGLEADSPRGRIYLMKALADGRIEAADSVVQHLDLCLDCRSCETACPSGVVYHELIEGARTVLSPRRRPSFSQRLLNVLLYHVFPHRTRLKLALLPARILQKLRLWKPISAATSKLTGAQLAKLQQMLPPTGPLWARQPATHHPPRGDRKMTVGFFAGCMGSALYQDINRKAIALLQHFGCEVIVPRRQRCCGAIDHHGGRPTPAERYARANIEAFANVDAIVTDIAGCGAMLKEYDHLLRDDGAWAERGKAFTEKVRDICELLVELDPPAPPHRVKQRVTYHDACHLAHAQKLTAPPRKLLGMIEGLTVVPLAESDMCCGAAGTYNLTQPTMARALADRKLDFIRQTGCTTCVTGNIGCALQIASEASRAGMTLNVLHPVDLLHNAYIGPDRGGRAV